MVSKIRNATDKSGQGDAPGEVTSDTALQQVQWYTGALGTLVRLVHWYTVKGSATSSGSGAVPVILSLAHHTPD